MIIKCAKKATDHSDLLHWGRTMGFHSAHHIYAARQLAVVDVFAGPGPRALVG
jgi:hypothetical protein